MALKDGCTKCAAEQSDWPIYENKRMLFAIRFDDTLPSSLSSVCLIYAGSARTMHTIFVHQTTDLSQSPLLLASLFCSYVKVNI